MRLPLPPPFPPLPLPPSLLLRSRDEFFVVCVLAISIPALNHPSPAQKDEDDVKQVDVAPSALFFSFNKQLGPPYHIILDTNFINFSIQNKLDPMKVTLPPSPSPHHEASHALNHLPTCPSPHCAPPSLLVP